MWAEIVAVAGIGSALVASGASLWKARCYRAKIGRLERLTNTNDLRERASDIMDNAKESLRVLQREYENSIQPLKDQIVHLQAVLNAERIMTTSLFSMSLAAYRDMVKELAPAGVAPGAHSPPTPEGRMAAEESAAHEARVQSIANGLRAECLREEIEPDENKIQAEARRMATAMSSTAGPA